MDLVKSVSISASALRAQAFRMRVIAENLANAQSVATTAGGDPYRRKMVTLREDGDEGVRVGRMVGDRSQFEKRYEPGNPAADASGYVLQSNVDPLVEMTDMKSAQRSYESNLSAIEAARAMTMRVVDLMR